MRAINKASFFVVIAISLSLSSCQAITCTPPFSYQSHSPSKAYFADVQGMVTYEIDLRADGKYVCTFDSESGINAYGHFTYVTDSIYLIEECDKSNLLCFAYYIDTSANVGTHHLAIPQCNQSCEGAIHDELWFNWKNKSSN